jgi:AcrR family transcriptional regulator
LEITIHLHSNPHLYLRDPDCSSLGKLIVQQGVLLMNELGYEQFTFRKLAINIQSTEATIYKYFENKHRFLLYCSDLYWSWLQQYLFIVNLPSKSPWDKLMNAIEVLCLFQGQPYQPGTATPESLRNLVISEAHKCWLTKHVTEDNRLSLFKPFKDLNQMIAGIILENNPDYPYAHSLANTIIEMSHTLQYHMRYLPSLTDTGNSPDPLKIQQFITHICNQTLTLSPQQT